QGRPPHFGSQLRLEAVRSYALPEVVAAATFELAQDAPRDDHPMDLIRAIVDPREASVPIHPLQRRVARYAHRAVDLDRAIDHVVQHLRAPELDDRNLDACLVALIDLS